MLAGLHSPCWGQVARLQGLQGAAAEAQALQQGLQLGA